MYTNTLKYLCNNGLVNHVAAINIIGSNTSEEVARECAGLRGLISG